MKATTALVLVVASVLTSEIRANEVEPPRRPPNILFILVDDLGWSNVSYSGSRHYRTPNVDALAASGMVFTNAYAASPVCSPTRASVLTGKYPARLRLTAVASQLTPRTRAASLPSLPRAERTFANDLADAGYKTLFVGKWHLGPASPRRHGFQLAVATSPKPGPRSYFPPYGVDNLREPTDGYLTDRLTDEAIRFLEKYRDRPFALYLSHYAIHRPWEAPRELVERHRGDDGVNPVVAAMIQSVDDSLGRLLAKLTELDLAGQTVVVFTSDNGALLRAPPKGIPMRDDRINTNAPLRGGKGSLFEGGLRVPLVVRWPGVIRAGAVDETPVISPDFLPTFLELAGVAAGPERELDGVSLMPLLTGTGTVERESLYFHYPHGEMPASAVRAGDHKLIRRFGGSAELYDLSKDLSESKDLAADHPERVARLDGMLERWLTEVDAWRPPGAGAPVGRE